MKYYRLFDYLYNRPVDEDEETNLALQILQMMLCGSESNPWPRLQFEKPPIKISTA